MKSGTTTLKRILAVVLTAVMLLGTAPLAELAGVGLSLNPKAYGVSGYSAGGAAKWALEHWRDHDSVLLGTGYWDNGGDCANFVSQCLYMGGLDMDSYWNTSGYLAHWTEPHGWTYAGSFIRCVQLYNYLTMIGGEVIHNPAAWQVDIGDVIIYYRPEVGRYGHSAIVADKEGGVPKIAYHSTGWNCDLTTNWHLNFSGSQTYLIKMHGSVCVNQRTRSIDVYKYAWGDSKMYWSPNGGYTNHYFISNDYAHVTETYWDGYQAWGYTKIDNVTGWVKLNSFQYMGHYSTPSVSHAFGAWQTVKVGTCVTDGQEKRTCTRCGYQENRTIPGTHQMDPAPTCTTPGLCKACGIVMQEALGHVWDEGRVSKQPTCTEPGDMLYYCERDASHKYTDEGAVPALGHDYQAVPTAPTCVQDGITTYTCTRCGDSYVGYSDENNTWSGWTEQTPAAIGLSGDKVRTTTQYRYRDKRLTDSPKSSLDGWELYDTTWVWGDYGSWSAWSRTVYTASDSRQVETNDVNRTQYNYSRYSQYSNGTGICGPIAGTWSGVYCGYFNEKGWIDSAFPVYERQYSNQVGGYFDCYNNSSDGWFNQKTREVFDHKEYRYRDRSKVYTYHYFQWQNWSAWSETQPAAQTNREIESRTVYSYDLAALGHKFTVQQTQTFRHRDLLLTEEQVGDVCYSYGYTCARCGALAPDSVSVSHDIPDFTTERDQYEIVSGTDASVTVYKGLCRNGCGCYVLRTVDNHNYEVREIVPPTCSGDSGAEGYTVYRCTFHGEEYRDDFVPALADDYSHDVWEVRTNPTCTQAGEMICKCARFDDCGHFITREIPPLGHTMTEFGAVAMTCTQDGNSAYYYCASCEKYFADEAGATEIAENSWILPHTGHSAAETAAWTVEVERKCGSAGWDRKYCVNEWCDGKFECDKHGGIHGAVIAERETDPIPADFYVFKAVDAVYDPAADGDTEFDKWISTTCDHTGVIYVTCRNCEGTEDAHGFVLGETYSLLEAGPIPHTEAEEVQEALCIYEGVKRVHCSVCGRQDVREPEVIPAPYAEHDLADKQENGGCIYQECTRCGYTVPGEHDFRRDPQRDAAPTCLEGGVEAYTCSRCGRENDRELDPLGHDMAGTGSLPATCLEGGVDTFTCQREGCGFSYDVTTSQPLNHDDSGSYTVTQKATCTADGKKVLTCVRVNPRTGETCGEELRWLKIPARGHAMGGWQDHASAGPEGCGIRTCVNTETDEYAACGYTETQGHEWADWQDNGDGTHSRTCLHFDAHRQSAAHVWSEWETVAAPDLDNDGLEKRVCGVCAAEETRPISKLRSWTVTFVVNDENGDFTYEGKTYTVVGRPQRFTSVNDVINPPAVPPLEGFTGRWKDYTLTENDIVVPAVYTKKSDMEESDLETKKEAAYVDGEVEISLEAFAKTNNVKTELGATPYDIILVVDQSGSMAYVMDADRYPNQDKNGRSHPEYHETEADTRNAKLKKVAGDFVGMVAETGLDHRIAIVGFGMAASNNPAYQNTAVLTPTATPYGDRYGLNAQIHTAYQEAFVSVKTGRDTLQNAIDGIQAYGATAADLGFEMAKGIFANTDSTGRKRLVIFLTDGEPTYSSTFESDVANRAVNYAYLLKNVYQATVYSIAISGKADPADETRDFNQFLHRTSSNYPFAKYSEKGTAAKQKAYYYATTDADQLNEIFRHVFASTVSNTISFDKVTLYDTVSDRFTLTVSQEEALRADLKERYGATVDDVTVTRNLDGTTSLSVCVAPRAVYENNVQTGYGATVTFRVSPNEKALSRGEYETNTADAGVLDGEGNQAAAFSVPKITIPQDRMIAVFKAGDEIFEIRDVRPGEEITAPQSSIGAWNIEPGTVATDNVNVFHAELNPNERIIKWNTGSGVEIRSCRIGQLITPPPADVPQGMSFAGWDQPVPHRMPTMNLEFTATFTPHTHAWKRTGSAGDCVSGLTTSYRCDCGETKQETAAPTGHSFEAIITRELEKSVVTLTCPVCGAYTTQHINYQTQYDKQNYNRWGAPVTTTTVVELDLFNASEVKIQPDQGEAITVYIPLTEQQKNMQNLKVFRIGEDQGRTQVDADTENGYIVLHLDHFSYYVITADEADIPTYGEAVCAINDHRYNDFVTPPSCTKTGFTTHTCSVCGDSYVDGEKPAAHTDENGDGVCDVCGNEIGSGGASSGRCVCGQYHTGPFAWLIRFFHRIVYFFRSLFGIK